MTLVYNTEPAKIDIFAIQGDALDMTFYVNSELLATGRKFYVQQESSPDEGTAHSLGPLLIQVRRKDYLLVKEWISDISPADIVITSNAFHLTDADGFLEPGVFDYAVQDTDKCIMQGEFFVKKKSVT